MHTITTTNVYNIVGIMGIPMFFPTVPQTYSSQYPNNYDTQEHKYTVHKSLTTIMLYGYTVSN